uniref:Serotonin N-acetyltransferase n=1 Tax=Callorhinchus milii TaxID=7868 RepID=U5LKN1_CALMI|nr:arylalkylamine N-acetyltransferase [Callorhinchus milii]
MQTGAEIRWLSGGDVYSAWELETAGYPPEEAASLEILQYRQREAGELFPGYYINTKLIGFVCGTRSFADHLTDASMKVHEAGGPTVCIHSVCVDVTWRRKGIALSLLQHYVRDISQNQTDVHQICLLSHQYLLPLYIKAGFSNIGLSSVVHGPDKWYECILNMERC